MPPINEDLERLLIQSRAFCHTAIIAFPNTTNEPQAVIAVRVALDDLRKACAAAQELDNRMSGNGEAKKG